MKVYCLDCNKEITKGMFCDECDKNIKLIKIEFVHKLWTTPITPEMQDLREWRGGEGV